MSLRIRGLLGILVATVAAILFLKYADTQIPLSLPSHLYQASNPFMAAGFPWWAGAGVIIGVIVGVSLIHDGRQVQQGFANFAITIALVGVILSYFAFTGYTITLPNYLIVAGINVFLLLFVAVLPAGAGLVIISMLTSRPPKRSAWEIMPNELKADILRRQAQPKKSLLPDWLPHRKQTTAK